MPSTPQLKDPIGDVLERLRHERQVVRASVNRALDESSVLEHAEVTAQRLFGKVKSRCNLRRDSRFIPQQAQDAASRLVGKRTEY
jgi:tRNA(Arg) A34 adenosine deaminase TadA